MKRLKILFAISQVVILLLVIACSDSEDSRKKGVVEKTQDKISQDAVNSIKDPLEQANMAKKIADERTRQTEEMLKEN